MQLETQLQQMS